MPEDQGGHGDLAWDTGPGRSGPHHSAGKPGRGSRAEERRQAVLRRGPKDLVARGVRGDDRFHGRRLEGGRSAQERRERQGRGSEVRRFEGAEVGGANLDHHGSCPYSVLRMPDGLPGTREGPGREADQAGRG